MVDITRQVIEQTDVDEEASKLASSVCFGNERKSWLHKVEVSIRPNEVVIELQVKLRNRHAYYVRNPFTGKKSRIQAYSDTSTAKFIGFVGSECTVQAYVVQSANEIYKVLGAFATLLVNSPPLKLLIVNEVCPLIGLRNKGLRILSGANVSLSQDLFTFSPQECLLAFGEISNDVIDCKIPVRLTEKGKEEIISETFGVITDFKVDIIINFKRSEIPDIFEEEFIRIPQQSLSCELGTNQEPINIDFTISPTVLITEGRAVNASINMDNVEGIPSYLGNLLKDKVNSNQELSQGLVDLVNDSGILG